MNSAWQNQAALRRYFLFQTPGIVLTVLIVYLLWELDIIAWPLGLAIVFVWIVKEIMLYPLLWQAYLPSGSVDSEQMKGRTVKAVQSFNQEGFVRLDSELWKARLRDKHLAVLKGTELEVLDVEGLSLIVQVPQKKPRSPKFIGQ